MSEELLAVQHLSVGFEKNDRKALALHQLDFTIQKNEIVCIVGESGSGKSVTAKAILKLLPKDATYYADGRILFQGENLLEKDEKQLTAVRGSKIAMIFQDSTSSLNPVYKIKTQFSDILQLHAKQRLSSKEKAAISAELLEKVEIKNSTQVLEQYPFQLSGGMRQRVQIAMSLVKIPQLLIADEVTTALDVIVQNQIIALLKKVHQETHMSLLFISHDLSTVYELADRIIVMQKGKIIEQGTRDQIFFSPKERYTKDLLNSIPRIDDGSVSSGRKEQSNESNTFSRSE